MAVIFGLGNSDSQYLRDVEARREESRQFYWDNQKQIPLINLERDLAKKLITVELIKKNVSSDYIKDARYIQYASDCRGWYDPTTEIIAFRKNDFEELELTFDREFDLDDYLQGLSTAIDHNYIGDRPRVLNPNDDGFKITVNMLNNVFYGWLGSSRVDGSYEPICELSKLSPKVELNQTISDEFYTSFNLKRKDGRVAWVYFPVEPEAFRKIPASVNAERLFERLDRMSPGYRGSESSTISISVGRVWNRLKKCHQKKNKKIILS